MNARGAERRRLPDGRWHFHHGPIDLVIGAEGEARIVDAALEQAWQRFAGLLDELVAELPLLRAPRPIPAGALRAPAERARDSARRACASASARGPVARRMIAACDLFATRYGLFVTPMAAVAGSVAQEIVAPLSRDGVRRAWVDNGGDIALWLGEAASVTIGVVADLHAPTVDGVLEIGAADRPRGVATSGWRGRSLSRGIADAVTVLADTAAIADVAATLIANAVDVAHPSVRRAPASQVRDDSDLGEIAVTVDVGALSRESIDEALERGTAFARRCIDDGLVEQALLSLQGRSRIVAGRRSGALA